MAETSQASRYHTALKAVVKRAINDAALAHGYTEATVRFIPTAREIAQANVE